MSDEGWRDSALCAQTDPDLFFPDWGEPAEPAKRICGACTVRADCLAYALGQEVQWGVWGGYTTRELRDMRLRGDAA